MIEIKHRYTEEVICSFDVATVKEAVEEAVKREVNLAHADLVDANLAGAYLAGAYLARADLADANLADAYLAGAYLARADLADANLAGANLARANLARANLARANIADAYLAGANLARANLARANIADAYLAEAKNLNTLILAQNSIVSEGQLIGWKKLKGGVIAKLSIPASAKRLNSIGSRKCRASQAFVLELSKGVQSAFDSHTGKLEYKVGHSVDPDSFDEDIYTECSHGIHFFITKEEAEAY